MTKPIIAWPGGKRRYADKLLPLFPNHKTYVEAFAGGAGLLFMRPVPAPVEVLNDINGELINLYRVVQHHLDEFIRQFEWALISRQDFLIRQQTPSHLLTDIHRAARFYYLQKTCFGGKVVGQNFAAAATQRPRLNLERMEEDLAAAHDRLARVTIEQLPWDVCINRYDRPETFFFLDPPYWQLEGYGVDFGLEQYQALADTIAGIQGKAIMTVNDHPDMRRIFRPFKPASMHVQYTIGNSRKGARKPASELVIKSWIGPR